MRFESSQYSVSIVEAHKMRRRYLEVAINRAAPPALLILKHPRRAVRTDRWRQQPG